MVNSGEKDQCTCPWFTSHQTDRGLCKHILAVKLKLAGDEDL
ncbi:SWIM zinc finger family protein [Chryseolinea lacunae]|uniref:SWIM zinc finger family protein n=1 Tax=Chryseolinea lacunae TaxID=2801331 RepID=A0ABS1L3D0_9BACT|nr:SWIM zinc finger family protein [Chryseolinea lacunae]